PPPPSLRPFPTRRSSDLQTRRCRHVCWQQCYIRTQELGRGVAGKADPLRPTDVQVDGFSGAEVRYCHKERSRNYRRVGELDQSFFVRPSRLGSEEHVESARSCCRNKERGERYELDSGFLRYRWQCQHQQQQCDFGRLGDLFLCEQCERASECFWI